MKRNLTLIFACFLFAVGASAQRTRQTDSLALVELYNATGGPAWTHRDNWLTGNLSSWYGVTTQATSGRVDSLRLCANNLRGELPDALVGLDSLCFLLMQDNYLYGHIPLLGKIPYYDSLVRFAVPEKIRPCYQCYPLSGNKYQFGDIANDPNIEKATYDNAGSVKSAYERIHISRSFSKDTVLRLTEGDPVVLEFEYTAYPAIYFVWVKDNVVIDTTDAPVYTISNFNATTHEGQWCCIIYRKSPPELATFDDSQLTGRFQLVAKNNAVAPKIQFIKSELNSKDVLHTKECIRTLDESIPSRVGIVASSPSAFASDLKLELVKRPEFFQLSVFGSSSADATPSISNNPGDMIQIGSAMSGYNSYILNIKPKTCRTAGTDTIIVRATDLTGRFSQDTFLLRTIENDLLYCLPELAKGTFSLRKEPAGTWLRWQGINTGVEHLRITVNRMPFGECEPDYSNTTIILDTAIQMPRAADSIFFAGLVTASGSNFYASFNAYPSNRIGSGASESMSLVYQGLPAEKFSTGRLYTGLSASGTIFTVANRIASGCTNLLYQEIDGKLQDSRYSSTNSVFQYTYMDGSSYRYWLADCYGRFFSDTVVLKPQLTGSLSWSVGTRTAIPLSLLTRSGSSLQITATGSKYCTTSSDGTNIYLSATSAWQGADTLLLQVTFPNGNTADTFALLTYSPAVRTRLFKNDTVHVQLSSDWSSFGLSTYLQTGIRFADVRMSMMQSDSIRFRNNFTEIRPAVSYNIDEMDNMNRVTHWSYSFTGIDTATLVGLHKSGAIDTLVIIADCSQATRVVSCLEIDYDKFYSFQDSYLKSRIKPGPAFYADEPETFPTRVDLREILKDTACNGEVMVTVVTNPRCDKGLTVVLDGPYLTVRPKPGLFYGFEYTGAFGNWESEGFSFILILKNEIGEWQQETFSINVTEKPLSIETNKITVCGRDTTYVDLLGSVRCYYEGLTNTVDWTSKLDGSMTLAGSCDANGFAKIWSLSPMLKPEIGEGAFSFSPSSTFGKETFLHKDIEATVLPTCDAAPVLSGIPVQYIGTASPQLDLWAHVQDNWPASGLFWDLTGGNKLSWKYDYATGILTAQPKTAGWKGTDTITVTVTDPNGLKSSASVIYTTGLVEIKLSSCASYTFGNRILDKSGTYTEKFKAVSGADSTVILHLTVNPVYSVTTTKSVAYGEAYQFGTQRLTKNGSYTEVFKSVNGCDSTVTLAFTVLADVPKVIELTQTSCGVYSWRGRSINTSGVYYDSLKAVSGADSTYILRLTVNPVYAENVAAKLAFGSTLTFGTQSLKAGGTYTEVFKTAKGCDSTVTLKLEIIPPVPQRYDYNASSCSPYTFYGQVVNKTGDYADTVWYGGFPVAIRDLHFTHTTADTYSESKTVPFGQTYQFGTQLLDKTGEYTETFKTGGTCDSVVNLHLTVLPEGTKLKDISKTACGEYTFAGKVLTASGIYKDTLKAVSGADSIIVLTLTINPVYNLQASKSVAFGQTYQFGTQLLVKSGSFSETFLSVNGCDSTVTLVFTVLPEDSKLTEIEKTACSEYTFAGKTLTASGIYKDTLKAVSGADSIVVLTLTINPVYNLQATKSVLYGQTYQFGTQKLDKSGSFTEKFQSVNGCDSTVTLAFTVLPNSAPHITLAVREFNLAENSANGTTVGTITATDSEGAVLVYSINGSTAFAIDPATGAVTVKDSSLLDYESVKTLTFTVRVSDGTAYDEAEITVTLTDVVETGLPMNTETVIIFPNTFSDRLSISATAFHGTVLVTAQNGAEVYSAKFGGYTDINTRNWPAGKYTVSIVSGTQVYSETLIKE